MMRLPQHSSFHLPPSLDIFFSNSPRLFFSALPLPWAHAVLLFHNPFSCFYGVYCKIYCSKNYLSYSLQLLFDVISHPSFVVVWSLNGWWVYRCKYVFIFAFFLWKQNDTSPQCITRWCEYSTSDRSAWTAEVECTNPHMFLCTSTHTQVSYHHWCCLLISPQAVRTLLSL